MTEIAEKQLQIIDQLMSKLEAGGSNPKLPTREMELHEKDRLYKKLCALKPEHLATACSLAELTEVPVGEEGDYTLDLLRQPGRTLWRLWDYAHKNAQTPAQKRAADKHRLSKREAVLRRCAAVADSSDSSDDDLSDSDDMSDSE